jgi:Ribonuclease T2 family
MLLLSLISFTLSFPFTTKTAFMDCLEAPYCGILTLQRGQGRGEYNHPSPSVHGLWPQVGRYGNSKCLDASPIQDLSNLNVTCFDDLKFEKHEWDSHGVCASKTPQMYFDTVCGLSRDPLEIMKNMRRDGKVLGEIMGALKARGYPVQDRVMGNDQLAITVCAGNDLIWRFSAPSNFGVMCAN